MVKLVGNPIDQTYSYVFDGHLINEAVNFTFRGP